MTQGLPPFRSQIFPNQSKTGNSEYFRIFRVFLNSGTGGIVWFMPCAIPVCCTCENGPVRLHFFSPFVHTVMSSKTDEFPSEQAQQAMQVEKPPPQPRNRGEHMTVTNRAAQFPDDMEPPKNDTEMWCKHCDVLVHYHEKKFATNGTKGRTQQRLKKEGKVVKFRTGPAAPVLSSREPEPEQNDVMDQRLPLHHFLQHHRSKNLQHLDNRSSETCRG